jgi:YD repeat-containing protein
VREQFGAHEVALLVPAGLGDDEPLPAVCWTARRGCSRDLATLAEPLIPAPPRAAQPPEATPPLADHERMATLPLERHPELLAELAPGVASALVHVVPVDCEVNATGGLFVIDAAGAPRRTSYEEELLAYLGLQAGRAVSEIWLRERERVGRERLRETSAELQRLVDEMDELGVIVRSIADSINVGVLFYDVNNQPRLHNRRVEELLALTGFDPKTGRSTHVYASDRRTRVKQDKNIISETLEGDQRGLIYWIGDPAGEQRAIVTEAHAISRVGGERLGSVVVTYDVTDLANAIEIREEYLATVSHELRTPLTSIVGYLDLIEDARDVDALGFGKEFRTIQRSAEQMLSLIRDLLSTSTHDLALRIEPTDVSALLAQSVSAFRPTLDSSHQQLRLETPGAVLAHVDPGRIKQVVDNLISNAVKYTSDGGAITVRLERDAESLTIAVTDTGRGISKTDQARLFDRFFRSRDVREAAIQGVGIGLTIVKTIVLAHGGTIDVESEPGQGSTFLVRLPLRAVATPLPTLSMQP